jgi:putative endonuclease
VLRGAREGHGVRIRSPEVIGWLYRAADALRRRRFGDNHGRVGEDLAHRYLRRRGCTVVARNYRTMSGSGEIDLVVWQGPTLVFVEVKTRATNDFGSPDRAVDEEKEGRLRRAARDYARRAGVPWDQTRFDLVNVTLSQPARVEWLRDAFRKDPSN